MLITGTVIVTASCSRKFGLNLSELFGAAADRSGKTGAALLEPGKQYGTEPA